MLDSERFAGGDAAVRRRFMASLLATAAGVVDQMELVDQVELGGDACGGDRSRSGAGGGDGEGGGSGNKTIETDDDNQGEVEVGHKIYLADLRRLQQQRQDAGNEETDEQALCQRWTRVVRDTVERFQAKGDGSRERERLFDIVRSM